MAPLSQKTFDSSLTSYLSRPDLRLLNPKERILSLAVAIILIIPLTLGFLPTSLALGKECLAWMRELNLLRWWPPIDFSSSITDSSALQPTITPNSLGWELVSFPLLALLFHLSLPKQKNSTKMVVLKPMPFGVSLPVLKPLLLSVPIPFLISCIFGVLNVNPPITLQALLWWCLFAPLGEEWLWRGWFYDIIERFWPSTKFTLTFPFPTSVWLSALGFSLWHSQNLSHESASFVLFQMAYTFISGLWLGYFRWKTGGLFWGCLLHCALNLPPLFI